MIRRMDDEPSTFFERLEEADRFFMGTGRVPQTVRQLAADFEREGIDYAIVGGMALNAHGYRRETIDVDVLVRPEGLEAFRTQLVGRGYLEKFQGAKKSFKNTQTGVTIEFLTTGEFPGDGKPKPVAFPDPAGCAETIDGVRIVDLPTLVNLKLASGMTAPHRRRDLADVQDLIRVLKLDEKFAESLNLYTRATFLVLRRELEEPDAMNERGDSDSS